MFWKAPTPKLQLGQLRINTINSLMQNMKFKVLLVILLHGVCVSTFGQAEKYQNELDIIFSALSSKEYSVLAPLLDQNVKIGNLPQGINETVVPQVLNQLPKPINYKVVSIVIENSGDRVNTIYTYEGGKTRPQSFLFNANKKVIDFDVLSGARTMTSQIKAPENLPKHLTIPFTIENNMIVLKAFLNGKEVEFILDSGSPTLILDEDFLKSVRIVHTGTQALGVGGKTNVGSYFVRSFNWQGITIKDFEAKTMSLGHLMNGTKHNIAGLIGYSVFKDYQISFDYSKKIVSLFHTDDSGNIPKNEIVDNSIYEVVPFTLQAHIPIISIEIRNKKLKMGLDCGAGANLLYAKYVQDILPSMEGVDTVILQGAGKTGSNVQLAKVNETNVGNIVYKNLNYVFEDATLTQLNYGYGLSIDGLLGYEFLSKRIVIINYKKGIIMIKKN